MINQLGAKIMIEFVTLIPKTYSYLTDDDKNVKKANKTKKLVIQRILKFNDYKNCVFTNKNILKSRQRFKGKTHCVYTE